MSLEQEAHPGNSHVLYFHIRLASLLKLYVFGSSNAPKVQLCARDNYNGVFDASKPPQNGRYGVWCTTYTHNTAHARTHARTHAPFTRFEGDTLQTVVYSVTRQTNRGNLNVSINRLYSVIDACGASASVHTLTLLIRIHRVHFNLLTKSFQAPVWTRSCWRLHGKHKAYASLSV